MLPQPACSRYAAAFSDGGNTQLNWLSVEIRVWSLVLHQYSNILHKVCLWQWEQLAPLLPHSHTASCCLSPGHNVHLSHRAVYVCFRPLGAWLGTSTSSSPAGQEWPVLEGRPGSHHHKQKPILQNWMADTPSQPTWWHAASSGLEFTIW